MAQLLRRSQKPDRFARSASPRPGGEIARRPRATIPAAKATSAPRGPAVVTPLTPRATSEVPRPPRPTQQPWGWSDAGRSPAILGRPARRQLRRRPHPRLRLRDRPAARHAVEQPGPSDPDRGIVGPRVRQRRTRGSAQRPLLLVGPRPRVARPLRQHLRGRLTAAPDRNGRRRRGTRAAAPPRLPPHDHAVGELIHVVALGRKCSARLRRNGRWRRRGVAQFASGEVGTASSCRSGGRRRLGVDALVAEHDDAPLEQADEEGDAVAFRLARAVAVELLTACPPRPDCAPHR